jgi:hypothetical protein
LGILIIVKKYILKWSYIVTLILNLQSNLCTTATLGTPKKWPLFKGWPLFRGWSKILGSLFIRAGDSGRSSLTGDRCSEVAVSTGLKSNYCF